MCYHFNDFFPARARSCLARVRIAVDDRLHPSRPPAHLRRHISPLWLDFDVTGRDQVEFLTEMAALSPDSRVLDIGCGVGRVALPLCDVLGPGGSYEGFDVFRSGIEWCQQNITIRRPNFRFHIAKVSTPWSEDNGPTAAEYKFPYVDSDFDVAYAGSLFTHLIGDGSRNYLAECARVLKPGGRLVSTWLLYNSEATKQLTPRSMDLLWPKDLGDCRAIGNGPAEGSVLYDEVRVREWFVQNGLHIIEPVRVDPTYNPAFKPQGDRTVGMNLYYACCIVAVNRKSPRTAP